MDRACEGSETRQLALDLGFVAVVPPMSTRIGPWEHDRAMYKRRNEVERLFRSLKGYRRIFFRVEKHDVVFIAFNSFALFADGLRLCQQAQNRAVGAWSEVVAARCAAALAKTMVGSPVCWH